MMQSIERLKRRVSLASVMPLVMLVTGTHPNDPVRKSGGTNTPPNRYVGVVPVPSSSHAAPSVSSRLDSLLELHRDARAERGRVLYATGHAPKPVPAAKPHRGQCTDRVVSARANSSPNS